MQTAALLPSLSRVARIFASSQSSPKAGDDLTEPSLCHDRMGTVCQVHGCARFLDEAPLIFRREDDADFDALKVRRFPNSWNAIATHERPGLFRRTSRTQFVAIRYCPECREAAENWLQSSN